MNQIQLNVLLQIRLDFEEGMQFIFLQANKFIGRTDQITIFLPHSHDVLSLLIIFCMLDFVMLI